MKKLIWPLAALLLSACQQDDVNTVVVKHAEAQLSLQSTGELASEDTISIGPPMVRNGWQQKITFMVPEGTWVKTGERVLAFDQQSQLEFLREAQNKLATEKQKLASQTLDSEQKQEQLKLDIAEAKMNLTKAERKAGQDGDYAAQLEVQKLQIDLAIAKKAYNLSEYKLANHQQQQAVEQAITAAEVERLAADVANYQNALARLTIKAPKDGIVVYVTDWNGSKSAVGDQINVWEKVVELPNLNKMIVKTTIAEHDISKVAVGQSVNIRLDALPDKAFTGKIKSLGQVVRVKSRREPAMVFDAEISIDNPDVEVMRPGMAARLNIVENALQNVVALPEAAVIYQQGQSFVRIKGTVKDSQLAVQVQGRQNGQVFVSGELVDGMEVIL